jgi:shikimate dehydrogenase
MKLYGLIGYPLTHSFSKKYFNEKFEKEGLTQCKYENYPLKAIDELPDLINNNPEIIGLNVTIPYKEKVLSFLDMLDENARKIGAVNTIKIIRNNLKLSLKGFNTDTYGFYASLKPYLNENIKHALILGTGGASKAVAYILAQLNISFSFVTRTPRSDNHISYTSLSGTMLNEFQLIVNTSPVGMFPAINDYPDIPYGSISKKHILFDLIYNPPETVFLKKGKEMGAQTINGLPMLRLQAEKAWEIWNSETS